MRHFLLPTHFHTSAPKATPGGAPEAAAATTKRGLQKLAYFQRNTIIKKNIYSNIATTANISEQRKKHKQDIIERCTKRLQTLRDFEGYCIKKKKGGF